MLTPYPFGTQPKIIFLDEPTSGVDSALSYEGHNYIKVIGRINNVRTPRFAL
jgi:ABC-type multidrug transport system ATPase subunit